MFRQMQVRNPEVSKDLIQIGGSILKSVHNSSQSGSYYLGMLGKTIPSAAHSIRKLPVCEEARVRDCSIRDSEGRIFESKCAQ